MSRYDPDPIPLVRAWRWLTRLWRRYDCWARREGHLFQPYDLYTDRCLSCGKLRAHTVRPVLVKGKRL